MRKNNESAGIIFRKALVEEKPLQIIGAVNAYFALMAQKTGYRALYLSGGGVAACSLGLPDLGISAMDDVLTDVRRITDVCNLPLLVDIDVGFGGAFNIARTIRLLTRYGAAACHIEDQVLAKRCGHRPNKAIVSKEEMVDRIKAAVDAKLEDEFFIIARTDALAVEGLDAAIERAVACKEAGADGIFPEAITSLSMYKKFADEVEIPVLANITEFGQTPLFSYQELQENNVSMILHPLSTFRSAAKAALTVYQAIRKDGDANKVIDKMQTRKELYDYLDYHSFEKKLDELFAQDNIK